MSMTLLQNLNYAAPYPGNLMRSVFSLKRRLAKEGIETIFLFPERARELYWIKDMINNGETVYFKTESFSGRRRSFLYILKRHSVDVVHTHFWCINDMLCIRLMKLKRKSMRSIVHYHNHYSVSGSRVKESIKRWLLNADVSICCSDDIARELRQLDFPNVCSVNNAIDFSRLYNGDDNTERGNSFLLFGFDYYRKGVDLALDAFKMLDNKNMTLRIVFAANEEQGIERIKDSLGCVPDRIEILPPTDDIGKYYRTSLGFISASREEGLCYSVMEAAYCNCLPIVSDIPGHSTDIPEIKIFESGSAEGLKNKIADAISEDNEKRRSTGEIQKRYVIEKYSLEKWCSDMADIFLKLKDRSKR